MHDESLSYVTTGGVRVERTTESVPVEGAVEPIVDALDARRGVLLTSSYEYPGRYTRWDLGFVDPPLAIAASERSFAIEALNERGVVLLPALADAVARLDAVAGTERDGDSVVRGEVAPPTRRFREEERSRQPSVFSVLRGIVDLFASPEEGHLGLYGAFAYDLVFQFEPVERRLERPADKRDLVLYLPDEITVVDHARQVALRHSYDLELGHAATSGVPRGGSEEPYRGREEVERERDYARGEFADVVRRAQERFRRGDLFEVVPSQTFYAPCPSAPSDLFRRVRHSNPAPYGALMNLGADEYLVGASPEMFVRVEGRRVETCPISGTVARGTDVMGDADQILELLNSAKDTSELTMCTDVDRNDKSRICEPGTVQIIGRRQIEMYSRVIHTVDHVEGQLREEFDALDALLTHAWAVTVTGAPKLWAMRFIEEEERAPRAWYGGAIGQLGFDGNINTGLTLRTIRIVDGVAEVRAGATVLIDSDPDEEERETEHKASAFLDAVRRTGVEAAADAAPAPTAGVGRRILLVDYEDSFVHTLGNYLRQTGAEVSTVRGGGQGAPLEEEIASFRPDMVVLSPGPGRPEDFDVAGAVGTCLDAGAAVFGVCLGLQGIVEHFGGRLDVLPYPMHGKPSEVRVLGGRLFAGLPESFTAGRYHSLYAVRDALPAELELTAESEDGVVMAVEHASLPVAAVQFHPESLLSLKGNVGLQLVHNVVGRLVGAGAAGPARPARPPSGAGAST